MVGHVTAGSRDSLSFQVLLKLTKLWEGKNLVIPDHQ
jgi:hypothetical protein